MSKAHNDPRAADGSEDLPAWSAYQEEVAEFFRTLGLTAKTNVKVEGARGAHGPYPRILDTGCDYAAGCSVAVAPAVS